MEHRLPLGAEFVELLADRSAVFRRLDQLAFGATSIRSSLCGRDAAPNSDPLLLELLANAGEQRRLLVDSRLTADPQVAEKAADQRLEIRAYGGRLRPMLVLDDRCAILPRDGTDLDNGALLVWAPLATPCGQLFDLLWMAAFPLGDEGFRYDRLNPRELQVVHLLVHGATDQQVANRLGVSSRTVRNVVADLHRRFGTTSRMALGFRLAGQVRPGRPDQQPRRPVR